VRNTQTQHARTCRLRLSRTASSRSPAATPSCCCRPRRAAWPSACAASLARSCSRRLQRSCSTAVHLRARCGVACGVVWLSVCACASRSCRRRWACRHSPRRTPAQPTPPTRTAAAASPRPSAAPPRGARACRGHPAAPCSACARARTCACITRVRCAFAAGVCVCVCGGGACGNGRVALRCIRMRRAGQHRSARVRHPVPHAAYLYAAEPPQAPSAMSPADAAVATSPRTSRCSSVRCLRPLRGAAHCC
jgi:hypothetical protein